MMSCPATAVVAYLHFFPSGVLSPVQMLKQAWMLFHSVFNTTKERNQGMMGNEKGHTQGMNWSVEHAQTKIMKVAFCVTGESVVKHCTTAAVVVAGERASNRGIQIKKLQQQHICQRDTGKETGTNSPHCLHGETLERQPEMFDKAPEKRSLKVVNKRLRGVSALE